MIENRSKFRKFCIDISLSDASLLGLAPKASPLSSGCLQQGRIRSAYASAVVLRGGIESWTKGRQWCRIAVFRPEKARDALLGEWIMSKRLRLVLGTAGAIAVAIVWGIVATLMGVPSILITVGAVAIGAGIYSYQSRS